MEMKSVCVKRSKVGKTRKHIRWKRREIVVVERVGKHKVRVEMEK